MKKSLLLFFCLVFSINISKGEDLNNAPVFFDKYEKATLHFLDGRSVLGYGKIVDFLNIYKIKFKVSLESKPDAWTNELVEGITFHGKYEDFVFKYVKPHPRLGALLLELLEEGVVSLYQDIQVYRNSSFYENDKNIIGYSVAYYVKKQDENAALPLNGNFKRKARAYFQDCIGIMNKIKSKEFNKHTIPEMVYYYNDFCSD